MRQCSALMAFLRGSLAVGMASNVLFLASCVDYLTGQDPEPSGPLRVTRMTLSDPGGDNAFGSPIFTDTSSPLDCSLSELENTTACVNTPFKDMFSPLNSPPTPDSATKLRVVFNKIPLKLNGQDLEVVPENALPTADMLVLSDPNVLQLQCDSCAIPVSYNSLQVSGSNLSPNPTRFDYGPALQLEIVRNDKRLGASVEADPLRALEPATTYRVVLNPGLAGRNAEEKILLDDAARALLSFHTEPFQAIRVGLGDTLTTDPMQKGQDDGTDAYVTSPCAMGTGTAEEPYIATTADTNLLACTSVGLANDGVIAVHLNAGVDHAAFQLQTATATVAVDGGPATPVIVKLTNGASPACAPSPMNSQRVLYVAPVAGTWVPTLASDQSAEVLLTLRGADIRDVSQLPGHPANMGRNVLPDDVHIKASLKLDNQRGDGVAAADVLACP